MHRQLITRLFTAVDQLDWDSLRSLLHADIVYERPGYTAFVGREAVLNFYVHDRIIASGAHDLERIVTDERYGACWGRFVGLSRTGEPVDERFADVYEFSDGTIRRRRSHFFRPAV